MLRVGEASCATRSFVEVGAGSGRELWGPAMVVDGDVVGEEVLCRLVAWWRRFLVFSGGIEKRTLQVFGFSAIGLSMGEFVSRDVRRHTLVFLELVVG